MTESSRSDAPGAEAPSPSYGWTLLRKLKSYWRAYKKVRRSASYVRAGLWFAPDRRSSSGNGQSTKKPEKGR